MSECTCFELPPEMWTTHYGAIESASALEQIQAQHCPVPIYTTEAGECEHGDECDPIELDQGAYCPVHTDGVTCNACAELIQANGIVDEWPTYPCDTRKLADAGLEGAK